MTLLTITQNAAVQIGVVRPSTVVGNTATEVRKLLRYADQTGIHLRKFDWQALRVEKTFTSVATEAQTSTMLPTDWDHFINNSFWNRTKKRMLNGPLSPQDWQQIKATTSTPIVDTFTYRGSIFYIQPVPTAGHTFAYEYGTTKFCQDSGGTAAAAWAADSDTARISEEAFTLGLIYRFKRGEGQPWMDDFEEYKAFVMTLLGQDEPRRNVMLASEGMKPGPGIVVPEGAWSL